MPRRKKKNKKKTKEALVFPAPLAAAMMIAAVVALSYLWLCSRCEALGMDIKTLEREKVDVHKRVLNEEYKWSNMKSPRNIEAFLRRHKLDMTWPKEKHIVRIRHWDMDFDPYALMHDKENMARNTWTLAND